MWKERSDGDGSWQLCLGSNWYQKNFKDYISRYCTLIWLGGEGKCLKFICVLPKLSPADSHPKLEILVCASLGLL